MKKDYQFLIGQRFSVEGEIYVVRDLIKHDEHIFVRGDVATIEDGEIVVAEAGRELPGLTFGLNDVIQSLLIDEEIELFSPNYLAALDRVV